MFMHGSHSVPKTVSTSAMVKRLNRSFKPWPHMTQWSPLASIAPPHNTLIPLFNAWPLKQTSPSLSTPIQAKPMMQSTKHGMITQRMVNLPRKRKRGLNMGRA